MVTTTTKKRKKDSVFSKNLKKVLDERSINQKTAADLAGIKKNVLNDWLAGTTPQDLQAVQRLATAINCDFEWLVTGTTSKKHKVDELPLTQLFDIETDSTFSGLFLLEAKRLKRKPKTQEKEGVE